MTLPSYLTNVFFYIYSGLLIIIILTVKQYAPPTIKFLFEQIGFYFLKTAVLNYQIDQILDVFHEITREEDILKKKNYHFKKVDELKDKDEWSIIRIKKGDTREQIKNSLILQIPLVATYYKERLVLTKEFRNSFFDLIRYRIAQKLEKWDLVESIVGIVNEENRTKEFEIMKNIMSDPGKYDLFITELRIRFEKSKGDVNEGSRREFASFITDLSKGKYSVIRIHSYSREAYKKLIGSNLFKGDYKGVYAFARDSNIKKLNHLIQDFSTNRKITIKESEVYNWHHIDGRNSQAKTVVFEKQ